MIVNKHGKWFIISAIIDKTDECFELFSVTAINNTMAIAKAIPMITPAWRKKIRRGTITANERPPSS